MNYLLDTNVVSQLVKPVPSVNVLRWLASVEEIELKISVITVRDLLYGVEKAKREKAATMRAFSDRIETVIASYEGRVLLIDEPVARVWASMLAQSNKHVDDTGLAATASVHRLVVVTRNLAHLRGRGVPLFDPFRSPAALVAPAT